MRRFYLSIFFFLLSSIMYESSLYAQCYNDGGSACGSGATGTKYITLDPTNATDSWNGSLWYYYYQGSWSSNNNYVDWYCPYAGAVYEIAMDGYTDDEVTITKDDGSNKKEYDTDNNGDGQIATYTCLSSGYYRIRFSRQGGCCTYSSCSSYNGWAWVRIRVKYTPCSGSISYGSGVWNGYVYDGVGPDYYYGSIGTQPASDINVNWGTGQPINSGCGQMCDADNYATLWYMNNTYTDGVYVFSTPGNDDGRVLSNNGASSWNLMNDWGAGAGTTTTSPTAMNGNYNMVFFQRENTGGSAARLTTCQMSGGNLQGYGTGNWRVFDYATNNYNFNVADYRGTFTTGTASATSASFGNLTNSQVATASNATGGQCGYTGSGQSIRALLTNSFTSGVYSVTIGNDDNYRISFDGGSNWPLQRSMLW